MQVKRLPTFSEIEHGVCAMLGCTREEFRALSLEDRGDLVWEWTATLPWEDYHGDVAASLPPGNVYAPE